jgi:hypothetical protein
MTMNKSITATIANTDREMIRLKLPTALGVEERDWATGVSLEDIYVGRRWFVVELNSIWDRGDGTTVGTYYTAYDLTSSTDRSDILRICERLDIEPPAKIEAVEA